ncbi:MAG: Slp family lipoprotein, partial [Deltaproteobacteria bacterium]|nr:Slp family lipoprotein [Deltaproteobacteria bacterium]
VDYSEAKSTGRFIIEAQRFLDTAVYKEGKRITVAGIVKETRVKKIGKMDYSYPVIRPLEIKLSEPSPPPGAYNDISPMFRPWGPYYPYYPWPYPPPPPVPGYPYPYPYPYPFPY